ncbi:unnamed protein product [Linum trigynum]|uniref:Uncharacterized protein n=1 Tax=Linum trigynum TaxID=586398 RepID=A0AAV2CL13_9ROSI
MGDQPGTRADIEAITTAFTTVITTLTTQVTNLAAQVNNNQNRRERGRRVEREEHPGGRAVLNPIPILVQMKRSRMGTRIMMMMTDKTAMTIE